MDQETAKISLLVNFVDQLYTEKDFGSIASEMEQQIKDDLYEDVKDTLDSALVSALPNEMLDECERMLDAGDSNKAAQFMIEHIPSYSEVIAQSLAVFRRGYLMETTR